MKFRRILAVLAPLAVALLMPVHSPAQTPTPPPPAPAKRGFLISRDVPSPEQVARGQKTYIASCGFCHGSRATGGENGPDLVRSVLALRDEDGDQIGPVILKGRPDKGMPPIPLPPDQIKDVAAYLRARQQEAINRGGYQIQNVVTGDAAKGRAYFSGAGKCNTCHSPSGDLKGIASKFDAVALQARFLYPETRARRSGGNAGKTKTVAVTLAGKTHSGVLEYLDDFSVSLRDQDGVYQSYSRGAGVKVEVTDPLAAHEAQLVKYTDADIHNLLAYLVTLK